MNSCSNWTYPSDNDLFYTSLQSVTNSELLITGDEHHHLSRVMKYREGEKLYVTTGEGHVYHVCIVDIGKTQTTASILEKYYESTRFPHITFCLPVLKSADRIEFALEKLVELGFVHIWFYKADKAVKQSVQLPRMEKIALHALKQSLHAHKTDLQFLNSLQDIPKEKQRVIFSQEAEETLTGFHLIGSKEYAFIIGPEGGFSEREMNLVQSSQVLTLTRQRLRSETAIIYAASIITQLI